MTNIFFVVLHYRDVASTEACIDSLCKMEPVKNFTVTVVVVDNHSPDPFPDEKISCGIGKVVVIKNQKNRGYTGGMNTGIDYGMNNGADFLAVINNDTVVDKKFIKAIHVSLSDAESSILVPKIYFYKGTEFHHDRYKESERGKVIWYAGGAIDWQNVYASHRGVDEVDTGQFDKEAKTTFASGCCMVIPRGVIQKIGMFDDAYYLYYEDIDYSMRVKKAGFAIRFIPDAILWHKNARSAGGSGSTLQDYFISRNRLLFGMRYAPIRAKIALLREGVKTLFVGRVWQRRGILDFFMGILGKGSYPLPT